jgi:hypothetical protein
VSEAHIWGPRSGGIRDRRKGDGHSAPAPRSHFEFTIPTRRGELRLVHDGKECQLQDWSLYGGRAVMRGGVYLDVQDVRLLVHGLRYLIWDVDRADFPPRAAA